MVFQLVVIRFKIIALCVKWQTGPLYCMDRIKQQFGKKLWAEIVSTLPSYPTPAFFLSFFTWPQDLSCISLTTRYGKCSINVHLITTLCLVFKSNKFSFGFHFHLDPTGQVKGRNKEECLFFHPSFPMSSKMSSIFIMKKCSTVKN